MFEKPSYLFEFGHHGKNRVINSIENDHFDGAILGPSYADKETNKDLVSRLNNGDYTALFDPEIYIFGQGDRAQLNKYEFHKEYGGDDYSSGDFYNPDVRESFCKRLIEEQDEIGVDAYISPSLHMSTISQAEIDDWYDMTETYLTCVEEHGSDLPVFVSIPFRGEQLNDANQRSKLLNSATKLDTQGFYVSAMYEGSDVKLPLCGEQNVKSLLEFLISLKLNRYEVIVGSTHQIAHVLFTVGVDAFSSGQYKNLRTYDIGRWISDDQMKRTVIRYYSDELLESIRPDGLMDELYSHPSFDLSDIRSPSPYDNDLFDPSLSPAEAGWAKAGDAWEHYIYRCYKISRKYRDKPLDERVQAARGKISHAHALYRKIDSAIVGTTDEIDPQFYDDWKAAIDYIEDTKRFKRLKRIS